jgi:membrane fusion protein, copper/silver efflux system
MKARNLLLIVLVAAVAGAAGWFAGKRPSSTAQRLDHEGRKVLFYQSAMHPWIKSDKPGKCTICGMDLVPVYEGDKGFDVGEGLVALSSNSINVINVQTGEVRRQPLRRTLRVAGTIDDDDTRHRVLSAYVDGRIDKLFVNYVGAEVVEGQPLATLYSPMLLAAEREYVTLLKGASTSANLRGEHAKLVEAAALRLKRLGLADQQITALPQKPENDLHTEILAPMTGTVVTREIYAGQYVKEGDKLFEIADFSTMWLKFDAYERDLPWLKIGQAVEVAAPAVPGKAYSASITFIDPNLNDPTRSAKVRVEIPNPVVEKEGRKVRELYHRLYAEAAVKADVPEVLAVPRSAVLMPGWQSVVYVDKGGGSYEPRQVKLGRAGDDLWEVLEGVSEGERIVTAGNLLIDAQAQLNLSGGTAGHDHGATGLIPSKPAPPASQADPSAHGSTPLDQNQQKIAREFLAAEDAVRTALSGDDLAAFNQNAVKLHETVPLLLNAFDRAPAWQPLIAKIEANAHLEQAADLKAARKAFHELSKAVVEFVRKLRAQQSEFGALKVYECPMLKQAFPGAPAKGQWIQLAGPLRNPYFGAEMIDCGTEIK